MAKIKYPWVKERDSDGYSDLSVSGIYSNKKWIDYRDWKLSVNPLCEHCEKKGKITKAALVDHKIPVYEAQDPLMYDVHNLQSLCDKCHRIKTRKDNSKFSDKNKLKGEKIMNLFENE